MPKLKMTVDPKWLTRAEAATFLGVGQRTFDRWAAEKVVRKHYPIPGVQHVLFSRSELTELRDRYRQASGSTDDSPEN